MIQLQTRQLAYAVLHAGTCQLATSTSQGVKELKTGVLLCAWAVVAVALPDVSTAPNLEVLLKEATEAYRTGDYSRALALCHPVRPAVVRQQRLWWQSSGDGVLGAGGAAATQMGSCTAAVLVLHAAAAAAWS